MSGWASCKAGAGNFIVLKKDQDKVRFVPLGDAVVKAATDKKGNARKRVYVNAATVEALKDGGKAAIFPMNITTAEAMAGALKVTEADKAADSLVGRVVLEVTRQGAEGEIGTKYLVKVAGKLTPAEQKAAAKLELNDLDALTFEPKN